MGYHKGSFGSGAVGDGYYRRLARYYSQSSEKSMLKGQEEKPSQENQPEENKAIEPPKTTKPLENIANTPLIVDVASEPEADH